MFVLTTTAEAIKLVFKEKNEKIRKATEKHSKAPLAKEENEKNEKKKKEEKEEEEEEDVRTSGKFLLYKFDRSHMSHSNDVSLRFKTTETEGTLFVTSSSFTDCSLEVFINASTLFVGYRFGEHLSVSSKPTRQHL